MISVSNSTPLDFKSSFLSSLLSKAFIPVNGAVTNLLNNKSVKILEIDHIHVGAALRNTINADLNLNREEALIDIY